MNAILLSSFLKKNKEWTNGTNGNPSGDSKTILVDVEYRDAFLVCATMKIARAVADVLGARITVITPLRKAGLIERLVKSFRPASNISVRRLAIHGLVRKFLRVLLLMWQISDACKLCELIIDQVPVGRHIYDSLLRRRTVPSLGYLSVFERVAVALEVAFYFGLANYIRQQRIDLVILPDNAYRGGVIFELVKAMGLPSIVGIDYNGLSMHKYETVVDYKEHCRTPDHEIIHLVMDTPGIESRIKDYLELRTAGQEQQHDVLRAYAPNKKLMERLELASLYNLDLRKPIVIVMAHVFCDAPHAYSDMLFLDYEDWLLHTCKRLNRNVHVEYLVKEHPSSALYGERGLVRRILEGGQVGAKVLDDRINTKSLFRIADLVVTCGGTAGMEFPCFGVPVIVAARAPYSELSYIERAHTVDEYYTKLDAAHTYRRLGADKIRESRAVLYTIQRLMKVKRNYLGLGSQDYVMGAEFSLDRFFGEMLEDCDTREGYKALVAATRTFLEDRLHNLYDRDQLELLLQLRKCASESEAINANASSEREV